MQNDADVPADAEPDRSEVDEPAAVVPDPRDRRLGERRSGRDRRKDTDPPPGVERRDGDRRGKDRRREPRVPDRYRAGARHINEYPLTPEELEFINAMNAYKQRHDRPFPTWSEVLHVVRSLGYEQEEGEDAGDGEGEGADASGDDASA